MAFIIITDVQDSATKFVINTDLLKYAFAISFSGEGFRDRARTKLVLQDGTEFLIRETPQALITALGATNV